MSSNLEKCGNFRNNSRFFPGVYGRIGEIQHGWIWLDWSIGFTTTYLTSSLDTKVGRELMMFPVFLYIPWSMLIRACPHVGPPPSPSIYDCRGALFFLFFSFFFNQVYCRHHVITWSSSRSDDIFIKRYGSNSKGDVEDDSCI